MHDSEAYVLSIDTIGYQEAFELQKQLVAARSQNAIKDILILLEHAPVFTANREAAFSNIIAPATKLREQGIEVCKTDRGGDVTYHGPGQIVGYNIMDLKDYGKDLHRYIRTMEQVVIDTLAQYGIDGVRDTRHPGVWVGDDKIAAIGIAVKSGWITMHGFALNVNPNMEHYKYIIACGIADKGVTSMRAVLGRDVSSDEVRQKIISCYGNLFHRTPCSISREEIGWS